MGTYLRGVATTYSRGHAVPHRTFLPLLDPGVLSTSLWPIPCSQLHCAVLPHGCLPPVSRGTLNTGQDCVYRLPGSSFCGHCCQPCPMVTLVLLHAVDERHPTPRVRNSAPCPHPRAQPSLESLTTPLQGLPCPALSHGAGQSTAQSGEHSTTKNQNFFTTTNR